MKKLIAIFALLTAALTAKAQSNDIYLSADTMPTIQGYGVEVFQRWVEQQANEQVREQEISTDGGKVVMSFIVEHSGKISNIEQLSGDKELGKLAIGVIMTSPEWKPATIGTETVRVKLSIPVKFEANTPAEAFVAADTMPIFRGGGLEIFRSWIQSNVGYPEEAIENGIQGVVVVTFVIEKDGRLTNAEILQSPHKSLSEATLEIMAQSPKWTPATQRGRPVRLRYNIPVIFRLQR